MKKTLHIEGMTCGACEVKVRSALQSIHLNVLTINATSGIADVEAKNWPSDERIERVLSKVGYHLGKPGFPWGFVAMATGAVVLAFVFSMLYGQLSFDPTSQELSLGLVVAYGAVSSLHCIGMCGSLALTASLGQSHQRTPRALMYQSGRLISYTLSGLILGWLGQTLTISPLFKNVLLLVAGMWMILLALSMGGMVRFKLPQWRPKGLKGHHGAFVVGLLNALMPCGSLQTMQVLALSTGNPLTGAGLMLVFGLVTAPALGLMQWLAGRLSNLRGRWVQQLTAVIVLAMGFQILGQSPLVATAVSALSEPFKSETKLAPMVDGAQEIHLTIVNGKYVLSADTVKVNVPIRIVFDGYENSMGCANPLYIPWGMLKVDIRSNPDPIVLTPKETGKFWIRCWMDMVRIAINVI
jgi:sulfite exporter TauE/SafE/copper chaperone CopZ